LIRGAVILVTGATGNVGRNVVAQLLAEGAEVRAASRSPQHANPPDEVELVRADLTAPDVPSAVFDKIDQVFMFPARGPLDGFIRAAARAGVERIVLLSSAAVADEYLRSTPIGAVHAAAERAVAGSGARWTFVRPGAFMANDLRWAAGVRSMGVVRAPYGTAATAPIDERDIAAVAVRALLGGGHAGKAYQVTGPQALTQVERVGILGRVLGRQLRFEEEPVVHAREQLLQQIPPAMADAVLGMLERAVHAPNAVLPTVQEITGRPPYSYEEWVTHHVADFR